MQDKSEQLVKVYIVSCPGWAQDMVLQTVDDVLENMRIEIEELADFADFSIRIEEWKQRDLDGLQEFFG